ncbi:7458_t:CDS:1, partial [Diversispora eburnea]
TMKLKVLRNAIQDLDDRKTVEDYDATTFLTLSTDNEDDEVVSENLKEYLL